MSETSAPPQPRRNRLRRRLAPAVVLAALLLGGGRYWSALHAAPDRAFRAALDGFARQDLDQVRSAAEALQGLDGYEPHRRLLAGMCLLRTQQPIAAIVEFGFAREHSDTRVWAHVLSGEALYQTRRFQEARRVLSVALQLDPRQTDAHRWLAAIHYDLGALDHALNHLLLVAEQAPADPRPHRLIGLIKKDFELYREAIEAYRESLRRAPTPLDQDLLPELAECYVKQRQYREALQTLDTCPRSAQRLWLEAECRHGLGDRPAAGRLVDEALALDARHLAAAQLKAQMALEAGDPTTAVKVLQALVELYPQEWRPRYTLGTALQRLGQTDKATEQLKRVEELRDLRDRFTELHTQAIREVDNADVRYELGVVAQQLDKPLLAVNWFDAALALNPDHARARTALQAMRSAASQANAPAESK